MISGGVSLFSLVVGLTYFCATEPKFADVVLFWTKSTLTYHLSKTIVLIVDMVKKDKYDAINEIINNNN